MGVPGLLLPGPPFERSPAVETLDRREWLPDTVDSLSFARDVWTDIGDAAESLSCWVSDAGVEGTGEGGAASWGDRGARLEGEGSPSERSAEVDAALRNNGIRGDRFGERVSPGPLGVGGPSVGVMGGCASGLGGGGERRFEREGPPIDVRGMEIGGGVLPVPRIFGPECGDTGDAPGPKGLLDEEDETLERPDEPIDIILGTRKPCLLSCFPLGSLDIMILPVMLLNDRERGLGLGKKL